MAESTPRGAALPAESTPRESAPPAESTPTEAKPRVAALPAELYADVAVRLPLRAYGGRVPPGPTVDRGTFTYRLPEALAATAAPGQIVEVPFGRRRLEGVIVQLRPDSPLERTLEVLRIVDERPAMAAEAPRLARWMSEYYLVPFGPCLHAMLAPQAVATIETAYRRTRQPVADLGLSPTELAVLGVFSHRRRLTLPHVRARLPGVDPRPALERLIALGLLATATQRSPGTRRPKAVRYARLASDPPLDAPEAAFLRRSTRARAVIDHLRQAGASISLPELRAATRATPALLERLEKAGILVLEERAPQLEPQPRPPPALQAARGPQLSPDQARAWDAIRSALHERPSHPSRRTILLHGVTGSGKTELYLRAIGYELEQGRQVIVLVPEIALTPQAIQRFTARFGDRVGVWHSALPASERHDTWRQAQRGGYDVIIGSRSAVFVPLPRLGLIVIDEEHSDSYKQPTVPRYHAREVALERAALVCACVILGTATPSMESYWAAQHGRMQLLELPRRIAVAAEGPNSPDGASGEPRAWWAPLPQVEIVDMRSELRAGNTSLFSRSLQGALQEVLARGEQAILFLNRRGTATFVLCRDCGHVQSCPRCRLPLTFHTAGGDLVCHHCNHREVPPMLCPACGLTRIRYFGAGTEKVVQAVSELFPGARVLRWDADTTAQRGAHERLLAAFASGQADILIGTQMIAKGLDLPRVTLVGIVAADTSLHLPDFRSGERTFQLLTQVAGRAGRSTLGGRVILQTYRPEAPPIRYAAGHDYAAFYAEELEFRRQAAYPPFRRLVRLEYRTRGSERSGRETSQAVARSLQARIENLGLDQTELVGPAPAFFGHLGGHWRWQIIVKAREPRRLLEDFPLGPGWHIDVDPVDLL